MKIILLTYCGIKTCDKLMELKKKRTFESKKNLVLYSLVAEKRVP